MENNNKESNTMEKRGNSVPTQNNFQKTKNQEGRQYQPAYRKFRGACYCCNKVGHRVRDCRYLSQYFWYAGNYPEKRTNFRQNQKKSWYEPKFKPKSKNSTDGYNKKFQPSLTKEEDEFLTKTLPAKLQNLKRNFQKNSGSDPNENLTLLITEIVFTILQIVLPNGHENKKQNSNDTKGNCKTEIEETKIVEPPAEATNEKSKEPQAESPKIENPGKPEKKSCEKSIHDPDKIQNGTTTKDEEAKPTGKKIEKKETQPVPITPEKKIEGKSSQKCVESQKKDKPSKKEMKKAQLDDNCKQIENVKQEKKPEPKNKAEGDCKKHKSKGDKAATNTEKENNHKETEKQIVKEVQRGKKGKQEKICLLNSTPKDESEIPKENAAENESTEWETMSKEEKEFNIRVKSVIDKYLEYRMELKQAVGTGNFDDKNKVADSYAKFKSLAEMLEKSPFADDIASDSQIGSLKDLIWRQARALESSQPKC